MSYEIVCTVSGDRAHGDDNAEALLAARTLVQDHTDAMRRQGATREARASIVILRDGVVDHTLTHHARSNP